MDRRPTADTFRERLGEVLKRSDLTPTAFARQIGLDRSTLAQLMSPANDRLPRAETLATIAATAKVSVDWLLGLSQQRQLGAEIFGEIMQIERSDSAPIDDRMFRWMVEAAAYRVRTVPATFPDTLKTEEVIRFQYGPSNVQNPERVLEEARSRLDFLRGPETELEVCVSVQALQALARGEGQWTGLDLAARQSQLERMIELCDELYPSLRLFLYDLKRTYSVPFTVFGPLRAAIYIGQIYFVFTSSEHIRVLARRFDDLIRAAVVQPADVAGFVAELRRSI